MNIFITAGNTQVLIDQVRCLTNIFTGRTGAAIALHAHSRGHQICLATSHPGAVAEVAPPGGVPNPNRFTTLSYRTFDDLQSLMAQRIQGGQWDAIIHSAAVSDYLSGGVYSPEPGTSFDPNLVAWRAESTPRLVDRAAGKVKSDEPELWLRLVRAPKLVDSIRADWGFRGVLVKFKLEVGPSESQLLAIAERSRQHSNADLMVANTLESASVWALLGPLGTDYQKISRGELPSRLLDAVEASHREKSNG